MSYSEMKNANIFICWEQFCKTQRSFEAEIGPCPKRLHYHFLTALVSAFPSDQQLFEYVCTRAQEGHRAQRLDPIFYKQETRDTESFPAQESHRVLLSFNLRISRTVLHILGTEQKTVNQNEHTGVRNFNKTKYFLSISQAHFIGLTIHFQRSNIAMHQCILCHIQTRKTAFQGSYSYTRSIHCSNIKHLTSDLNNFV